MQEYLSFILMLPEEAVSKAPQSANFVFLLFLGCFISCSQLFRNRGKMMFSMLNSLYRQNDRQSIFYEATDNDLYSKLLLCTQSMVLLSIFVFCVFSRQYNHPMNSPAQTFLFLGGYFLLFCLFFLFKRAFYVIIGNIFFSKDSVIQWIDCFVSLICLSGIILFVPVLLMFYIDILYFYCYYFVLFYFFVAGIVIIYKTYMLFFRDRGLLLYLFLYLCAQEIIPLFLLYRGLIYLFNIVQKDTLWL